MALVITLTAWAALLLAALSAFYALGAAAMAARFFGPRRTQANQAAAPAVSLLKPLFGAEPGLRESLESFCRQDYAGPVQIVFGVIDPQDGAVAVAQQVQAAHPGLDITVVTGAPVDGANLKICNLAHIALRARHPILIVSDSDIAAPPDYLRRLVAALAPAEVGAATSLYVGQPRAGLWSRLSAMAINYQFMPNVVMGHGLGLAEPCMGSTIALKAEVLAAIGGFSAFRNHLADDYEIGRAVRARGWRVALPILLVDHGCDEKTAGELLSHEVRWGRTIRLIDGAGYFGTIITHGLPVALIGAVLSTFSAVSLALVVAVLLSRLILKLRIDAVTGTRAGSLWLVPLRDALSFVVFLASLTGSTVVWRGRRYRVGQDGVLSHL